MASEQQQALQVIFVPGFETSTGNDLHPNIIQRLEEARAIYRKFTETPRGHRPKPVLLLLYGDAAIVEKMKNWLFSGRISQHNLHVYSTVSPSTISFANGIRFLWRVIEKRQRGYKSIVIHFVSQPLHAKCFQTLFEAVSSGEYPSVIGGCKYGGLLPAIFGFFQMAIYCQCEISAEEEYVRNWEKIYEELVC